MSRVVRIRPDTDPVMRLGKVYLYQAQVYNKASGWYDLFTMDVERFLMARTGQTYRQELGQYHPTTPEPCTVE